MASKKKKRVKKYAVGGDLRQSLPLGPNTGDDFGPHEGRIVDPVPPGHPGYDGPGYGSGGAGGGFDDTATGQVRQVSQSARRAANQLSQAGLAQQHAGSMLGNTGRGRGGLFGPEYKKGGKVKKSAKKSAKTSVKVRGAGKAIKGVRPAKMVSMKGS